MGECVSAFLEFLQIYHNGIEFMGKFFIGFQLIINIIIV